MQQPELFTCAICGETFEKENTEEEALDELEKNFGTRDTSECEIVCTECYEYALGLIQFGEFLKDLEKQTKFRFNGCSYYC